jgi:hypothetical protein
VEPFALVRGESAVAPKLEGTEGESVFSVIFAPEGGEVTGVIVAASALALVVHEVVADFVGAFGLVTLFVAAVIAFVTSIDFAAASLVCLSVSGIARATFTAALAATTMAIVGTVSAIATVGAVGAINMSFVVRTALHTLR